MVNVDVGKMFRPGYGRSDHDESARRFAAINEAVAVAVVLRKHSAVTRRHRMTAIIIHEHRFAVDHHHEFVVVGMPMPLRGPGTRFEPYVSDTKVGQTPYFADAAIPSFLKNVGVLRGKARLVGHWDLVERKLRHC